MRTIVHVSDVHFGRFDRPLVDALVAAIHAVKPDLLAISGDLTQRARIREFAAARAFLEELPFPRLVVPGNHDVPLYSVRRFVRPLARYMHFIEPDLEPVHADEEIAVVGLNSTRSISSGGRLTNPQIARAAERLGRARPGALKIVVTHHPFDLPDDHDASHLVRGARRAMAQFAAVGADLFLAGHLHVTHVGRTAERYEIAGHCALVVQAGTMSTRLRGEPNSFNVLTLQRPHMTVAHHTWDAERSAFTTSPVRTFRHTEAGWFDGNP
jgi:3',5'-cyclic AMP phosphodiesterase CpdA